jgi:hypothetical protein
LRDVRASGSELEGFAMADFEAAAGMRAFGCGGFRGGWAHDSGGSGRDSLHSLLIVSRDLLVN